MIASRALVAALAAIASTSAMADEPSPGTAVMSAGSVGTISSEHCVMVHHGRGAIKKGVARLQGDTVVIYTRRVLNAPKPRCGQPYKAEAFGNASYADGSNVLTGKHVTWDLESGVARTTSSVRAGR